MGAEAPTANSATPLEIRVAPVSPSTRLVKTIFRHRYFEHITHLYNIQRIKLAQGLTTETEVPMEGYMALPGWDLSKP